MMAIWWGSSQGEMSSRQPLKRGEQQQTPTEQQWLWFGACSDRATRNVQQWLLQLGQSWKYLCSLGQLWLAMGSQCSACEEVWVTVFLSPWQAGRQVPDAKKYLQRVA